LSCERKFHLFTGHEPCGNENIADPGIRGYLTFCNAVLQGIFDMFLLQIGSFRDDFANPPAAKFLLNIQHLSDFCFADYTCV